MNMTSHKIMTIIIILYREYAFLEQIATIKGKPILKSLMLMMLASLDF